MEDDFQILKQKIHSAEAKIYKCEKELREAVILHGDLMREMSNRHDISKGYRITLVKERDKNQRYQIILKTLKEL